jgi:hypothetical protein
MSFLIHFSHNLNIKINPKLVHQSTFFEGYLAALQAKKTRWGDLLSFLLTFAAAFSG